MRNMALRFMVRRDRFLRPEGGEWDERADVGHFVHNRRGRRYSFVDTDSGLPVAQDAKKAEKLDMSLY